jgi:hypothetical protein
MTWFTRIEGASRSCLHTNIPRGLKRIRKGTETVPLPNSRYGCGSRTLIFEHPLCAADFLNQIAVP